MGQGSIETRNSHVTCLGLTLLSTCMSAQERDLARKLARLKAQDAMERKAHDDLAAYLRGKHEVKRTYCESYAD